MTRFTVAVVDDVPTPYRIALLRAVQAQAPFRLSVIWLADRGREKLWDLADTGAELEQHAPRDVQLYLPAIDTRLQLTWGLGTILDRVRPDVVVVGNYFHPGDWRALLYARRRGIPLVFWSGTTPTSEWRRGPLVRAVKRWFISRCDRFLAYGTDAKCYLAGFGVADTRIDRVVNTTDLRAIRRQWQTAVREEGPRNGPARLLFVGRLTPLKGVQRVLLALARLDRAFPVEFRICGDGHHRAELEALAARLGLADRVRFAGYVQQDALPGHLAWADVFVFPTTQEIWGIVVNEALAAGVYVLSSSLAGVTTDLIDGDLMGVPFDPRLDESLDGALRATLGRIDAIRARREERSAAAMRFDVTEIAGDLIEGLLRAHAERR